MKKRRRVWPWILLVLGTLNSLWAIVDTAEEYLGSSSGSVSSNIHHVYGDECAVSGCPYRKFKSGGSIYFVYHTCNEPGCTNRVKDGTDYCYKHQPLKNNNSTNNNYSSSTNNRNSNTGSSKTERREPYNASDYDEVDIFYDDHYDDFDGFDEAEQYWDENH